MGYDIVAGEQHTVYNGLFDHLKISGFFDQPVAVYKAPLVYFKLYPANGMPAPSLSPREYPEIGLMSYEIPADGSAKASHYFDFSYDVLYILDDHYYVKHAGGEEYIRCRMGCYDYQRGPLNELGKKV